MIVRIADVSIKLILTHEKELMWRYASYMVNPYDPYESTINSMFLDNIVSFDPNINLQFSSVQLVTLDQTTKAIINNNNHKIIHQMKFDIFGKEMVIHSLKSKDTNKDVDLEHYKCGLALAYVLFFRDKLMLHGSCCAYQNQGIIFSACSGVGKSTQSNLWKNYFKDQVQIINDDKPIMGIVDGKVMAYGTPFSGKNQINLNTSVPLVAVVFIRRSLNNHIRLLTKTEALPLLLSQLTLFDIDSMFMNQYLNLVESLLSKLAFYEFHCNMEEEAVKVAHSTIFGGNK